MPLQLVMKCPICTRRTKKNIEQMSEWSIDTRDALIGSLHQHVTEKGCIKDAGEAFTACIGCELTAWDERGMQVSLPALPPLVIHPWLQGLQPVPPLPPQVPTQPTAAAPAADPGAKPKARPRQQQQEQHLPDPSQRGRSRSPLVRKQKPRRASTFSKTSQLDRMEAALGQQQMLLEQLAAQQEQMLEIMLQQPQQQQQHQQQRQHASAGVAASSRR